ncbi:4-oxalocrotonate tautomerase family protein [Streptomyces sp. JJ36]|uniref:tautomerase family protein n=1 Tax=Streptomyces sp. JJ36 TaxID=2736645 RepID=UPI001F21163E|nr:4-oxalocrotonate tautomerase family protein [Streptomyces sp. JJ36]MCF6524781.1 4-oxalocrotonate tautomerase family protein [Streptomyces sp. JJ36]
MPVITVDWWKGNGRSRRAELVADVTSVVARVAGCPEEAVTVIVRDVDPGHWGKGGALADTSRPENVSADSGAPRCPAGTDPGGAGPVSGPEPGPVGTAPAAASAASGTGT